MEGKEKEGFLIFVPISYVRNYWQDISALKKKIRYDKFYTSEYK